MLFISRPAVNNVYINSGNPRLMGSRHNMPNDTYILAWFLSLVKFDKFSFMKNLIYNFFSQYNGSFTYDF